MKKTQLAALIAGMLGASWACADDSNTGYIYQGGDANYATMSQRGDGNLGVINQWEGNYRVSSQVWQSGTGNAASTYQNSSAYTGIGISQYGTANSATVEQRNLYGGNAWASQYGTGNNATIDQRDGYYVYAGGYQYGDANRAAVTQTGSGLSASYGQYGAGNSVTIEQSSPGAYAGSYAYAYQYGTGNNAAITQSDAQSSWAYSAQNGSGNASSISQRNITPAGYTYSWAYYYTDDTYTGHYDQSAGAQATVQQYGNANLAEVEQSKGGNLTARIMQGGSVYLGGQGGGLTDFGVANENDAKIVQTGLGNAAQIYQGGDSNTAGVYQSGVSSDPTHTYYYWNYGGSNWGIANNYSGNTAAVAQLGSNQTGYIVQTGGSGNHAFLSQGVSMPWYTTR